MDPPPPAHPPPPPPQHLQPSFPPQPSFAPPQIMTVPFATSPPPLQQPLPQPQPQPQPQLQQQQTPNSNVNVDPPPTYDKLIVEALTALKDREGSSKRAITKFIEEKYKTLPESHEALLDHHLKRMKKSGEVVLIKKSYKLPGGDDTSRSESVVTPGNAGVNGPEGTKRRPGRPPKAQSRVQHELQNLGLVSEPKKRPGRPKKSDPGGVAAGLTGRRGPGRPKKAQVVPVLIPYASEAAAGSVNEGVPNAGVGNVGAGSVSVPVVDNAGVVANVPRRGRPKKDAAAGGVGGVVAPGKRRGRPPMAGGAATGKRRGRPPLAAGAGAVPGKRRPGRPPLAAGAAAVPGKRRPGRPPRFGGAAAVPGRRPGRPPGVGRVQKTGRTPGRPAGRPRKNAANASIPDVDLMRKLGFFQSKIKQAVGVLRPLITSGSSNSAVAAIQELEGLAALDVTAPFVEVAQQPPVAQN